MGYDQSEKDHYLTGGSEFPTALTKKILTEVDQRKTLTASFTKPDEVETVQKPITLPEITNVHAQYTFGGPSLLKAKFTWDGSEDDRDVNGYIQKKGALKGVLVEVKAGRGLAITIPLSRRKDRV